MVVVLENRIKVEEPDNLTASWRRDIFRILQAYLIQ